MTTILSLKAVLDELNGTHNVMQKQNVIQRYFPGAQVKRDVEDSGIWLIVQNKKVAILSLVTNSLISIPAKPGESEFFGDISVFPIETNDQDITLPLVVTVGGKHDEDAGLTDITMAGTLKGDGNIAWITNPPEGVHTLHDYVSFVIQQRMKGIQDIANGRNSSQISKGSLH